jgi:hypothetical protein
LVLASERIIEFITILQSQSLTDWLFYLYCIVPLNNRIIAVFPTYTDVLYYLLSLAIEYNRYGISWQEEVWHRGEFPGYKVVIII